MTRDATPRPHDRAAAPAGITRHAYRKRAFGANGVRIDPLPGKKLTGEAVAEISAWLQARGWRVVEAIPAHIAALSDEHGVDDVPAASFASHRAREAREQAREDARAQRLAQAQHVLAHTPGGRFVTEHFGSALGPFNACELARYVDGSNATFDGLLTRQAVEVMLGMGIQAQTVRHAVAQLRQIYERRRPGGCGASAGAQAPAAADNREQA